MLVAGPLIGGTAETGEMPDSCARKNILSDCKMIRRDQINDASSGPSAPMTATA